MTVGRKVVWLTVFAGALFSVACQDVRRLWDSPQPAKFVLLTSPGERGDSPMIVHMNSHTGETWVLERTDPVRWVSVQDNLIPHGKWNPKTKTLDWGTRLPDGRFLHDLSKEELVRQLEAHLKSRHDASGDPASDALGVKLPK